MHEQPLAECIAGSAAADARQVDPMLAAAVLASRTPMMVSDPTLPGMPMVLVNHAFCRMTGYEQAELLGRNARMLQGPETDQEAVQAFRDAVAAGRETTVELLNYRCNGERFWSEVFITPVEVAGRLRYYLSAHQDSTTRHRGDVAADTAVAEAAPARIVSWRFDPAQQRLNWSEAAGTLFGISVPAAVELGYWSDLIHPRDRAGAMRAFAAILTVGQMTFEFRIDRRGETRWVEAAGSVVMRDAGGAPAVVSGTFSDVTQRRLAEQALQARESRSRLALEAARAGAWELDTATGRAITSPRHDEIMGHSRMRGAWTMARFRAALHPSGAAESMDVLETAFAALAPFHTMVRVQQPAAAPRWVEVWGRSAGAGSTSYYGIVADVTERRLAEEALTKAEAGFRLALGAARLGRWDHDRTAGDEFHDERMGEIFAGQYGVPLTGGFDAFIARVHPEDRADLLDAVGQAQDPAAHTSGPGSFVHTFRLAPIGLEAPRWVQCYGQTMFAGGICTRFLGVCQDITAQKRRDIALQDMNQTLEAEIAARTRELERTWRLSQELLAVTVAGQGIVSVNPAWERVLGWTPDQLYGRSMLDLVHAEDLPATLAETRRAESGSVSLQFRNRCRTTDGSYRTISWTTVPEGATFYLSGRDVTAHERSAQALEQAEAQMRQMQKMEAVGQLTGGIAHDFNNMLSVVIGGLTLVQRRLARGDTDVQKFIDSALDGAQRAGALTQRLLAFSRQVPLQPRPLDMNRLVAGMSDLLHRTLGETIQVEITASPGLWRVHVDHSQMENVVLNLAVNGRDAMPNGGRLSIRLANLALAEADPVLAAGDYATLTVTDTGLGMTQEVLSRVFEPFFTTKGVGAGTGLGLSQTYGFARQSGGGVHIDSAPETGTTVRIALPRWHGANETPDQAPDAAEPPQGRGELILLVEDEDRVRQFSLDALRDLNYTVIEASCAARALEALDANPGIALLFTDIVMPEVNGGELADLARTRRPGLKVLFTTGYARNAVVHDGVVEAGAHLLTKPFTVAQLAARLRELIDQA